MGKTDKQILTTAPQVEVVDGRTGWNSANSELDVGRLPPHLVIGGGVAVAFFIFVAGSLIEQLLVPDLNELSQEFLHLARNFCAVSAGLTVVTLIMLRKEAELSSLRRRYIDDPVASREQEITLDDVFPAESKRLHEASSARP